MGCKGSKDAKDPKSTPGTSTEPKPIDAKSTTPNPADKTSTSDQVKSAKPITYVDVHPLISKSSSPSSLAKNFPSHINVYFFGIEEDNSKKIWKFDPSTEQFSNMDIPTGLEIFNLSSSVYVSEDTIYITGGTNQELSSVTNRAFLYNPKDKKASELPKMLTERYCHTSIVLGDYLYVLGGLEIEKDTKADSEKFEEENSLKSCERYNIKDKKWEKIADLNLPRSLSSCFIYDGEIHILGGYIGKTKRTRTIEKYNSKDNKWVTINTKLPKSLESTFIFSPFEDTIQLIGGQGSAGHLASNFLLDLKDDAFICLRPLTHERVLHKGLHYKDKIYIFGGDDSSTFEEYDILKNEWKKQPSSANALLSAIKQFSHSQTVVTVSTNPDRAVYKPSDPTDNKCFIFGDDFASFILEANFTKKTIHERPVPTSLKLHGYQGAVKLQNGSYLLCGGITRDCRHVSDNSYLYNPNDNTAKKLSKLNENRYTFNTVVYNGSVYALGGRTWGEVDSSAILKTCEKYDLTSNKWQKVQDLVHPRCSSTAFVSKGQIHLIGGYKGENSRWTNVENYDGAKNTWKETHIDLNTALEGSSAVIGKDEKVYLIGGRTDDGDIDRIFLFDGLTGLKEVKTMKEKRSLNKVFSYEAGKVCIFGGENTAVEFISFEGNNDNQDSFAKDIESQINNLLKKDHNPEKRLLRFSIA